MKWRLLLSLLLATACAGPALAGLFGKKPVKPNPIDRVPELIHILKNDSEENKRVEAAEELRQFDPTKFPQIFVALIDALQNDPKPAVRSEAAQSLGKLRPVSKMVRQALEHARDKDPSRGVRLQAAAPCCPTTGLAVTTPISPNHQSRARNRQSRGPRARACRPLSAPSRTPRSYPARTSVSIQRSSPRPVLRNPRP